MEQNTNMEVNASWKERVAEINAEFNSNIKSVWNTVTNNNDYSWCSDIERVEIYNDGKEFIEYTHNRIATKFIMTKKDEYSNNGLRFEVLFMKFYKYSQVKSQNIFTNKA